MRIIFSRKGFDSAAGKAPSPIIEGEPISLPIPAERRSETSYRLAGLGNIVDHMTKGRIGADDLCHEDPMFVNGRWAFGQTGAAQSHLERSGVGVGDVFLFFGLFALRDGRDRHHRIFGYLEVDEIRRLGGRPSTSDNPEGFIRRHPHTIGEWNENNTLYLGSGAKARNAHPCLRLTKRGASVSVWTVPAWLKAAGLTYHSNPARWADENELHVFRADRNLCQTLAVRRQQSNGFAPYRPLYSSEDGVVRPRHTYANINLQKDTHRRSRS